MPGGSARRWVAVGVALVLAVTVAVLIAAPRLTFSGRCTGDSGITEGLADRQPLPAVVTDPLHLEARVPVGGPLPTVGTPVDVPGGLVPPPGTWADVVAVGAPVGDAVTVTMAIRPLDQVGGFPGTPPMPTMTPGARGTVTLENHPVGKTVDFSADSLRPAPARVPGPATIWLSDDPATGAMHAARIEVTRIVGGRVLWDDPDGVAPILSAAGGLGVVLPDRRCRSHGVWPPVLVAGRLVDRYSGTVQPAP